MQTTTEPTATHSPTPWERDGLVIRDHDGNRVLSIHKSRWADNRDDPEAEADAAFIVEAVNAHASLLRQRDALAEACKAYVRLRTDRPVSERWCVMIGDRIDSGHDSRAEATKRIVDIRRSALASLGASS